MSTLLQFLKKPFPQEESLFATLKLVAAISVFVVVFLYVFKPFGLHTIETGYFWLCLGFGVVTFAASMAYEFAAVRIFKIKGEGANFTFGRWLLYLIGVMLFISLANFLFVRLTMFNDVEWALFPYMIRGTFVFGLFPIIAVGAFALLKTEKKYQNIADELNQADTSPASVDSIKDVEIFGIPASHIHFIEAMQSYVRINYVDSDGQFREQVEHATLKSLSNASLGESIVRCHRSFYVNRDAIASTSGNAQGLLLSLHDCERMVPVSRSFVPVFRRRQG